MAGLTEPATDSYPRSENPPPTVRAHQLRSGAAPFQLKESPLIKITGDRLQIGGMPRIVLTADDAQALARALRGIRDAGRDATGATILTDRSSVAVTPVAPSGVTLTRGRTTLSLTGVECKQIVGVFG